MISRRTLIAAVAVWPVTARAQQRKPSVVGILHSINAEAPIPGLRRGLREAGLLEGQDFTFERRSAEGSPERLDGLARDLVKQGVAVIVAGGGPAPASAAQRATNTVPIVFFSGGDPVERHLVAGLARPGGNITGVTSMGVVLESKRLELLHQLLPPGVAIGALIDSTFAEADVQERELQMAATAVGRQLHVARTAAAADIDSAVAKLAQQGARGFVVAQSPLYNDQRTRLPAAAARHDLPTVFHRREFVSAGGLASYGTDFDDGYRLAGVDVARILKGAHPADLPIQQPTKFELVINLKTAKALGLKVPPTLLAIADQVIE